MSVEASGPNRASEFETLWNVIVAPSAAFEAIRERRRWLIAWLVVTAVSMVASYLTVPAYVHAMQTWYPTQLASDPRTASLTPAQQKQALDIALIAVRFGWLFVLLLVPLATLVAAFVLWLVVIIAGRGRGERQPSADFARLFSLAMNTGIVSFAIAPVVVAIIALVRGAQSFSSPLEMQTVLPSLAWVAPGAGAKLSAFLSAINPFSIWSFALLAFGTAAVCRVPRTLGYAGAAILILGTALIATTSAK